MNERPQTTGQFEELANLVKASFPDLRCLRCGNDEFYSGISDYTLARREADQPFIASYSGDTQPIITLGCTRCGHLEQHMLSVLEGAKKPITSVGHK